MCVEHRVGEGSSSSGEITLVLNSMVCHGFRGVIAGNVRCVQVQIYAPSPQSLAAARAAVHAVEVGLDGMEAAAGISLQSHVWSLSWAGYKKACRCSLCTEK
jgi:hypothetical protein